MCIYARKQFYGIIYGTMKNVVLDTNVFVTALMSRRGASFKLLSLVGMGHFDISISVPLVLEYEAVAKRHIGDKIMLTAQDVDAVIDYLCTIANRQRVFYLWRPFLKDPRDDMVLELAVSAGCQTVITYNQSDFKGVERFGIEVITPKTFLQQIGALP